MAELLTLDQFIERVKKDPQVSFVVAFKKDAIEEAYYAPGSDGCTIDDKLSSPVRMEDVKERLCGETYLELKALTMLSAYGSPGQQLVHLTTCDHMLVSW
jgi:hypothetical protein